MRRQFGIGQDAQIELLTALGYIERAVGSTLGPGGRPFGYDKVGTDMRLTATFSKDGLTVLRALEFDVPAHNAVLQYCRQASAHSVLASGDGTTSTIVLANAVAKAVLESGAKFPQAFAREIEADAERAIEAIKQEAIKSEEVVKTVAMTSTNGDEELANIVLEAIKHSSAFGTIVVDKNPASKERYRITRQDGYSNCGGYNYNPTFALSACEDSASSKPIEWENPAVAIFNGQIILKSQLKPIVTAWEDWINADGKKRNLVIFAYDIAEEIINEIIVLNRKMAKLGLACFVVKPRMTAEIQSSLQILRDLASYTGIGDSEIIDGGNLKEVNTSFLGTCGKIKIMQMTTALLGRAPNHWVERRVLQNQSIIAEARSEADRNFTQIRNAELAEGLVRVEVGGGLLPDLQERADRFDDASKAAQSCMLHGALPGGGLSYIRAGILASVHPILADAFRAVHNTILRNYGVEPSPNLMPTRGMGAKLANDNCVIGVATDLEVLDAAETIAAVIRNGVSLGVKIATIGGFSYRDQSTPVDID